MEKDGDPVRKSLMLLLMLLLTAVCACAAADTEYALEPCSGKMLLNEANYVVLTPDNLAEHPELISSLGTTQEELKADWAARGVLLQAWTRKKDACLEVVVVQDEDSQRFYDLEQQTRQVRNEYLLLHKGTGKYAEQGFTILQPAWKKQKLGGNFLKFEYKRTVNGKTWRGYARKTIRNGYTVLLDYQVFDRLPRRTDEDNLNRIANTVEFSVVNPASVDQQSPAGTDSGAAPAADASGLLNVTVPPPAETNEGTFTVEGQTSAGAHLIGVAMRWSSSTPLKFTADATRSGNFKLKVTLPEEGVWLVTLNLEINGQIVAEKIFDTTTYSKTILPVVLDSPVPEQLVSDELVISGTTSKGVSIQCIVTDGTVTFDKTVRTNGTGTFRFKVPVKNEGEYNITVVFSKKGYNTKRLTYTARRSYTSQDVQARAATRAIHPSYAILVKKLDTYIRETMVYNAYIVSVTEDEEQSEWIITAALKKTKTGYSDLLVFMAGSDPGLEEGSRVKLYGICVGPYQIQSEEDTVSYPGFDYLFHE